MADTIHKVGEGMYVLMYVLFFYLHVWCALRRLTLGYTATLPRGSPLRRIAGGSTSSARPGVVVSFPGAFRLHAATARGPLRGQQR